MPKLPRASAARARQRGFFDFSFPEIVITFGVALVVLGPKKLPGLVAQVGRWVGRARHMARQFREQLEQEVNSINAVKPVPRHAPPEVGPVAPPEVQAAAGTIETHGADASHTAYGRGESASVEGVAAGGTVEGKVAAVGNDGHPEAPMYFALDGTQPAVVAENPYAAHDAAEHSAASPQPAAEVKPEASSEPASVKVIFPHDHG